MIKAREVRKEFLKNPSAKPLVIAKKYDMVLPDVYNYRKQVREALAGKAGVHIDKDGVYTYDINSYTGMPVIANIPTVAKKGRPKNAVKAKPKAKLHGATVKVAASEHKLDLNKLDHYINSLIAQHKLDYKLGYAVRLLLTNKKKEALYVLTAE